MIQVSLYLFAKRKIRIYLTFFKVRFAKLCSFIEGILLVVLYTVSYPGHESNLSRWDLILACNPLDHPDPLLVLPHTKGNVIRFSTSIE